MALFQPTNITPSVLGELGNGTVDITQDLTVTWQVNGNSAMTAFEIVFYQNNTGSSQLYTTGKVSFLWDELCREGDPLLLHHPYGQPDGGGDGEREHL